jgi:hypothetical protein
MNIITQSELGHLRMGKETSQRESSIVRGAEEWKLLMGS